MHVSGRLEEPGEPGENPERTRREHTEGTSRELNQEPSAVRPPSIAEQMIKLSDICFNKEIKPLK